MMGEVKIVRIDDRVLRNLILNPGLYAEFPKFQVLKKRLDDAQKKGCRCRKTTTAGAQILAEARAYIQALSPDKKALLKKHLNATHIKLTVQDTRGRHTEHTW